MPQPTVNETILDSNYVIENSKAFIANVGLDFEQGETRYFSIYYPADAEVVTATLQFGTETVNLISSDTTPPPVGNGNYHITITPADAAANPKKLTCSIMYTGSDALDTSWLLKVKAKARVAKWSLTFSDPGRVKVVWLAADPVAALTPLPENVNEQSQITLQAKPAKSGNVAGRELSQVPLPQYVFSYPNSDNITIPDLPEVISPPASFPGNVSIDCLVDLPGVFQPVTIHPTVKVAFGNDPDPFLVNESDPAVTKITAQPQHIALVLDRSGSMRDENKWDNAKVAARALTHLFAGAREGVNSNDKLGIVTFSDEKKWHAPPVSAGIERKQDLKPLSDVKESIKTLPFGDPGDWTPLGDGLVAGLDMLAGEGAVTDRKLTYVLLTDGYENAGTTYIGPTAPSDQPAGTIKRFTDVLDDASNPYRDDVKVKAARFVIGLGATVDTATLSALGDFTNYLAITDPQQLAAGFAKMLDAHQEVKNLVPTADPEANTRGVRFQTDAGADRLVFAVLTDLAASTIKLERQSGTAFVPVPIKVESTSTHHAAWIVDVPSISADPIVWRVTLLVGDTAQDLPKEKVLAYGNKRIKAAVHLDQATYQTGDQMQLSVRVRQNATPIRNARVKAVLESPSQGLGEALSALAATAPAPGAGTTDQPPLIEAMIENLLRVRKWKELPRETPTGLFTDGTNELHDYDGDGVYTNTFDRVWKEGVYNWTLTVEGEDVNGNAFSQEVHISTYASIKVDARATKIKLERVRNHPSGMRATRVIVTPQDARHERLGPNKDNVVVWGLEDGIFEHSWAHQPAPVFTDGTYQRVVLYKGNQRPKVRVKAAGTLLRRIDIESCWLLVIDLGGGIFV